MQFKKAVEDHREGHTIPTIGRRRCKQGKCHEYHSWGIQGRRSDCGGRRDEKKGRLLLYSTEMRRRAAWGWWRS
jgi:hypothetical protein